MAGVGGAAVPGRLSLGGTEARPTEIFSYKIFTDTTTRENVGQPPSASREQARAPTRTFILCLQMVAQVFNLCTV